MTQESSELEPWQYWFCVVGAVIGAAGLLIWEPPTSVLDCFGKILGGALVGGILGYILSYAVMLLPVLFIAAIVYGFYKHFWLGLSTTAGLLAFGLVLRWKAKRRHEAVEDSTTKSIEAAHVRLVKPPESPKPQIVNTAESPNKHREMAPKAVVRGTQRSEWDVFISHAREDKLTVARPLAALLEEQGVAVWLDEYELKIGDSLRKKIDNGLARSRFGVVVLSKNFFAKEWTQRELNGLISRESDTNKVVIPVWHQVDHNYVAQFSPILADKLAADTQSGLNAVANKILSAINE